MLLCVSACNNEKATITSTQQPTNSQMTTDKPTANSQPKPSHTHSYSNATCTSAKKCSCGATVGTALGHNFANATCTNPKTCNRCGTTVGIALGHNYSAADCTNPKICIRCQNVSGKALGHDYAAATCVTPKMCTRCHNVTDSALGHSFVNEKCTRCGKLDRTYLLEDIDYLDIGNSIVYTENLIKDNKGNEYSGHYNFHSKDLVNGGTMEFETAKIYRKFSGTIFLPYEIRDAQGYSYFSAKILIYGDDKLLFQSNSIMKGYSPEQFNIDITGVSVLRIEFDNANFSNSYSAGYLTNAYLSK